MKRKTIFLLILLLFLGTFLSTSPKSEASAQSDVYACVTENDTYLYAKPNEMSALFLLPQSYYVKVLGKGSEYTYVQYLDDIASYKSVYGYCKTDSLLFVDYIPLNPYLYLTYTVDYSTDAPSARPENTLTTFSYPCVYYGELPYGGDRLAYVYINGSFGYLPAPDTLTYEKNTDYLDYVLSLQPTEPPDDPSAKDPAAEKPAPTFELTPAKLLLIIGIIATVLLVGCFLFVTYRSGRKKTYYYDD